MAEILLGWTMMLTAIWLMPMMEAGNEPYDGEFPFQPSEPTYRPWEALIWERLPSNSRQHWPVLSDPFSRVGEDLPHDSSKVDLIVRHFGSGLPGDS